MLCYLLNLALVLSLVYLCKVPSSFTAQKTTKGKVQLAENFVIRVPGGREGGTEGWGEEQRDTWKGRQC